jgi:hypothetical protein
MQILVQHVQSSRCRRRSGELPIPPELDELVLACLAKDPTSGRRMRPSWRHDGGLQDLRGMGSIKAQAW